MSKRKRGIPDNAVVQDYVEFYNGDLYYDVKDELNVILFSIPKRAIQTMSRDVVGLVIGRCKESKPVGLLLPSNVPVMDHRAFLPKIGSKQDSTDYSGRLMKFFMELYGKEGKNSERDDFYTKLNTPNLNLNPRQMQGLYFHIFILNEEQRADFPLEAVTNLRNRLVLFGGRFCKWTDAYTKWHRGRPNEVFNLCLSSQNSYWAYAVYKYKYKSKYPDTCVGEAELARNIVLHINERREKAKPPAKFLLDKCRIGYVLHKVVPKLNMKLFDFMWYCQVEMDFQKSLSDSP